MVVVLNTGGVLDTGFYREIEGLSAMIFISQAGVACGTVLADVLSGRAVPSGKLTSTWARNYSDYPASGSFRDNTGNDKFYEEGIYVGYRYFDSFGIEPAYAFGYGKSYTDFSWEVCGIKADEEESRLIVDVTNTEAFTAERKFFRYIPAVRQEAWINHGRSCVDLKRQSFWLRERLRE